MIVEEMCFTINSSLKAAHFFLLSQLINPAHAAAKDPFLNRTSFIFSSGRKSEVTSAGLYSTRSSHLLNSRGEITSNKRTHGVKLSLKAVPGSRFHQTD